MVVFLVVVLSILFLFVSHLIVAGVEGSERKQPSVSDKNLEAKSSTGLPERRADKTRVYLYLSFVLPPMNCILIFWLGPTISRMSRFASEEAKTWLRLVVGAFVFIYFTGAYYLGGKLLSLEVPSSHGRLLLISATFVSLSLWPLVVSIVMIQ